MSSTPYHFFLKYAGYSYDPKTQTPMQGRIACAKELAGAEIWATRTGCAFEWSVDPYINSSEFDDGEPYALWVCVMRDPEGVVCASLGWIDFGRDGEPWGDPYRRIVQAELASES